MPWARLDDGLNNDAKLNALSSDAYRLWVRGLVFCQKNLTDGFIPADELPLLLHFAKERERQRIVAELLSGRPRVGKGPLWHEIEGGYQMHDYLDHNDPRDKVLAERARAKERLDRYHKKRESERVPNAVMNFVTNAVADVELERVSNKGSTYHVPQEPEKQERADAFTHECGKPVENRTRAERLAAQIRWRRRMRSKETADGEPAVGVMSALARDVLQQHPYEENIGELRALLKDACVRANLLYDGFSVAAALDKARAQLKRKA